jgi:sulfatase maturation enzyme AslB (radical SAM superfamily)
MAKFFEKFFCPAPWTSLYYHIDNCTPCHLIHNGLNQSPEDYIKSDWLKNIKEDFVKGRVPSVCHQCKTKEDNGFKSTRGAFWNFYNTAQNAEMDISAFTIDAKTQPKRLELRFSNLCNFKCRMCVEDSSSEIAREKKEFNISQKYRSPKLNDRSIYHAAKSDIENLKKLCLENVNIITFTGGEPLLIKEYYDFLDFLIDNNLQDKIALDIFSNCSVYNPQFIDRILKFKLVYFVMSIDGVGKTAEYQRHGTNWTVVKENIYKFNSLPLDMSFNTAISAYVLLDVSSLASFLMHLYRANDKIKTKCYSVQLEHETHARFLPLHLRKVAIEEINKAVAILTPNNFRIFTTELIKLKNILENTSDINSDKFVNFTKQYDAMRNESFETTFGLSLT